MPEEQYEAEERERNEELDTIRTAIANGVAAAQSAAYEEYAADLSLVNVLAEAIVRIEEDESDIRPGKINTLMNLKQEISSAVDRALELPAELFSIDPDDTDAEE